MVYDGTLIFIIILKNFLAHFPVQLKSCLISMALTGNPFPQQELGGAGSFSFLLLRWYISHPFAIEWIIRFADVNLPSTTFN